MRPAARPSVFAIAAALALAGCPGTESKVDTGRCDIDLGAYHALPGGADTVARQAVASDLMEGDSATGRAGDWLLANDRIRVIVQGPDRHPQPNPYGGAIVDADVVRGAGERSSDQFGKVAPLFQFGRTVKVEKVEPLTAGGAAILAATGPDEVNDYLNVKNLLGAPLAADPDQPLSLRVTTYYVLPRGDSRVRIITAFCNGSGKDLALEVGDLIDSGGDVEFFNPRQRTGGFGYVQGFGGTSDFPFYAYWGSRTAYAYVPPLATGNDQVTVSGVTGTLLGQKLLDWVGIGGPPATALRVPAGGSASYQRFLYVGRTLGEVTSAIYQDRGATVQISGLITLGGSPVEGARVAVVKTETDGVTIPHRHPIAVFATGPDGRYAGRIPPGSYSVAADAGGVSRSPFADLAASSDATFDADLPATGRLHVALRDPGGEAIPGKVLVYCESGCVSRGGAGGAFDEGNFFRASTQDPWPAGVQAFEFADSTGALDVDLPGGGLYTVVASHGPAWSVYPASWPASRGVPFAVPAGPPVNLAIELAQVVDHTGWISADTHVHGVNSPDSPVIQRDRLKTFLADGVDVLVATDHDYVTDYGPALAALDAEAAAAGAPRKASDWLATLLGEELTTFDYGHWNGYPILRDAADLVGGAVDWGNDAGPSLAPAEIHAALRAMQSGAEVVVQANHPRDSLLGWFTAIRLDTASGATHACPQRFRMAPLAGCDPALAADTHLFDESFTAMEIVNDHEEQRIHGRMNDWLAFLSRGLVVTAVAVSDTHHRFLVAGGYGRTWVKAATAPPGLDATALAAALNAHRAVASMGAFADLAAVNGTDAGATWGIGDVASAGSDHRLTLTVTAQTPEWLAPSQVELHRWHPARVFRHDATGGREDDYGNRRWPGYLCLSPAAFELPPCNTPSADQEAADFAAFQVLPSPVVAGDLVQGFDARSTARVWKVVRTFTVDLTGAPDTWFVAVVRRDPARAAAEIAPGVFPDSALTILAVTNAIRVDTDRDGVWRPPAPAAVRETPFLPPPERALSGEEAIAEAARRTAGGRCR